MAKLSLTEKLDRFPPVAVRLLARVSANRHTRALLDGEVASQSEGLTIREVRHISRLATWDEVTVGTMRMFLRGCGADLDSRDWLRQNAAYMRKIKSIPRFLLRSPEWSTTFEPLIDIWLKHEQGK